MVSLLMDFLNTGPKAFGLVFGAMCLFFVVYSNLMIDRSRIRSRKRQAAVIEFPYLIIDNADAPGAA